MKRFDEFRSQLRVLERAHDEDLSNEFIKSGIIDKFYIEFELAWKTMKEYLKYEGIPESKSGSPRDIIKAAYKIYDCIDEDKWLAMLRDRNDTAHIYDENAADRLVEKILEEYIGELQKLRTCFEERYSEGTQG